MDKSNEVSSYIETITLLLLGLLLFAFPLFFLTATTDAFALPKQALLSSVVLLGSLLFGVKMISDGKVRLRKTPFDTPILLLLIAVVASAFFSVNRVDSVIAATPFFFAAISFFLLVQFAKDQGSYLFLSSALITGVVLAGLIRALSYFSIYILPISQTRVQTFTPLGLLLDHCIYLLLVLPLALLYVKPIFASDGQKVKTKTIAFATASIIIVISLSITIYQLITNSSLFTILPFQTGFQTAFAAISQDQTRALQGFLLGSGFGTYVTDFTRYKLAAYNQNLALWSFTFFRSSSFVLELLATVGVLGVGAFIFLLIRILGEIREIGGKYKEGLGLLLAFAVSFFLPFSFTIQTLLFFLLGLFAIQRGHNPNSKYFDIELAFVALRKSLIPLQSHLVGEQRGPQSHEEKTWTKTLPVTFFVIILLLVSFLGFFCVRYIASDVIFQGSIIAASQNNALKTYNDQTNAIRIFPHRDGFYRVYSQTNLTIANSLATTLQNQEKTNTANTDQTRQTITTLIQQSIDSARNATAISPQTMLNWQNLSSIYRSLIGFGQNAQQFAILSQQQAINLDPSNPQQYLDLGGIYYQLKQWDQSQNQFQIAVSLKPDLANAHYNLGHALEQKGNLQDALAQYQAVKTLVANDKANLERITKEIEVLVARIGEAQKNEEGKVGTTTTNQPPLGISEPQTRLPKQQNQIDIPAPQENK